ncbi:hypothetical protein D3C80_1744860 [compost metagenome]
MGNGFLQLHAQCRSAAVADHRSGITNQNEVDDRVDQRGNGAGIGRQTDDFLLAFHGNQLGNRYAPAADRSAHQCFPGAGVGRVQTTGEGDTYSMYRFLLKSDPGTCIFRCL